MSKSFRKSKIFGNCGGKRDSEKKDKLISNRSLRRKNKTELKSGKLLTSKRENSNIWSFKKDGKHYWKDATKKDMRK